MSVASAMLAQYSTFLILSLSKDVQPDCKLFAGARGGKLLGANGRDLADSAAISPPRQKP